MLRMLLACAIACVVVAPADRASAAAHSAPRQRERTPELPGEQPTDDTPTSYADEWPLGYVPNLIDIPATELVEREHPTLELGYMSRAVDGGAFSNLASSRQSGARLALHVRAFRDLQVSLEAPLWDTHTTVLAGDVPGQRSIEAVSVELKYLVPYEVAGFRAAVGLRYMFSDDNRRFLFFPDDFQRMNMAYASISRTPTRFMRMHLMYGAVFVPSLDGLPQGDHNVFAFGLEQQLYRLDHNWVRLILEAVKEDFHVAAQGPYGHVNHAGAPFVNAGFRVRSGILQVEIGARHLAQTGFSEQYAEIVKRF